MMITVFDSESFCGYKQITTFFSDFSIADAFGLNAIKETYDKAFEEWKSNYKYITELCMVMNWKCWQHSGKNDSYCEWYSDKFYELRDWCLDNFNEEEMSYFFSVTD